MTRPRRQKRLQTSLRERRLRCSSGKAAFRDRLAAMMALSKIPDGPRRAYRCGECRAWHLTSQR